MLFRSNALLPGYRPALATASCGADDADFKFTAIITMADHADEAGCQQHAAMGFETGWGAAFDQLVAMVKKGI